MKTAITTTLAVSIALCLLVVQHAAAQVPMTFSYQGSIAQNGTALDGTHLIHVALYDSLKGGTALFEESQLVPVSGGIFNLIVGSTTPIPSTVKFDRPYFLGVSVDGSSELAPRTQLTAVPYSISSHVAELAQGLTPDARGVVTSINELSGAVRLSGDSVTSVVQNGNELIIHAVGSGGGGIVSVKSPDNTIAIANPTGPDVSVGVADNAITSAKLANGSVTLSKLNQAGAKAGQILKWNGSSWVVTNDSVGSYQAGQGISITGNTIAATGGLAAGTQPSTTLRWNGVAWVENTALTSDATGNTRINGSTSLGDAIGADNITLKPGSGTITVQGFGTGIVKSNAAGVLSIGTIDLTTDITGILPVQHGGTGVATLPLGQILIGNGTNPVTTASLSAGNGITITPGANSLTITNTDTSRQWRILGNSGTDPLTNFLGTTDSKPIVFRTNNIERARLDANGNLGIGTAAPQQALELKNGNILLSNTANAGSIAIASPGGANMTSITTSMQTANIVYKLPGTLGTANQVLSIATVIGNTATLGWTDPSGGGGNNWLLTGNSGTIPGTNFLGTTDNQPLYLQAKNSATVVNSFILDTNTSIRRTSAGNLRGTYAVDLQYVQTTAAAVASGAYSFIGSGSDNTASGAQSVIVGGDHNTASGQLASIGGGGGNRAFQYGNAIGGGYDNVIDNGNTGNGQLSTIAGGFSNQVYGMHSAMIGGYENYIGADKAVLSGGASNYVYADYSFLGGGGGNTINSDRDADKRYITIAGGQANFADSSYAFIGGGYENNNVGNFDVIAGGANNLAQGHHNVIGGGSFNVTRGLYSGVLGGFGNFGDGTYSAVGGGQNNLVNGTRSAIAGGAFLRLQGDNSFGFHGGSSPTDSAVVAANNTAFFGNVNLWLGNTNNTPGQVRFYEAQNGGITFPGANTNFSSFQAGAQSADIQYTLPSSQPSANQFLSATAVSGSGPYTVTLGWADASSGTGYVVYGPTAQQATLTPRTTPLFDIGYLSTAANANAAGAKITSSAGSGGNFNATGLTVVATATGTGLARAIDATGRVNINTPSSYDIAGTRFLWVGANGSNQNTLVGNTGNTTNASNMNTLVGYNAGKNNDNGSRNTFVGAESGFTTSGGFASDNTFLGAEAGYSNTTGTQAVIIGSYAGYLNTTGNYNIFIGENTGYSNTSGSSNTFVGMSAGWQNTANSNSLFGQGSGWNLKTGSNNTFVGTSSGYSDTSGASNVMVGVGAGMYHKAGDNNTYLGRGAGSIDTAGVGNTMLGYGATPTIGSLTNATAIGNGAQVAASNSMVLGSISPAVKVGIGTTIPLQAFNVENGNVLLSRTGTNAADTLMFQGTSTGKSNLVAGAQGTTTINYTLPLAQPSANQVLSATAVSGAGPYNVTLGWATNGATAWQLAGNSGTTAGTNYIGTNDNQPFEIHIYNNDAASKGSKRVMRFEPNGTSPNIVGGYQGNSVGSGAVGATIGGGGSNSFVNSVSADYASIGGGLQNTVSGTQSVIAGGATNTVLGINSAIVGGESNWAAGSDDIIGGGVMDSTLNTSIAFATGNSILGGYRNKIGSGARFSAIGGGIENTITGSYSAIPGGDSLRLADNSFGMNVQASGSQLVVTDLSAYDHIAYFGNMDLWLGNTNNSATSLRFYAPGSTATYASKYYSSIKAGSQSVVINYTLPSSQPSANQVLSATAVSGSGPYTVALGWANIGGSNWTLTGNSGTTAGTNFLGTTDNQPFEIHVYDGDAASQGSKRVLRIEPTWQSPNIIAGYQTNSVTSGYVGGTIAGGGISGYPNVVAYHYGTVGGGFGNTAWNTSTVAGGGRNTASGSGSNIGGGTDNYANASYSTISGGYLDTVKANSDYSVIGGGTLNRIKGMYSSIAGGSNLVLDSSSFGFNNAMAYVGGSWTTVGAADLVTGGGPYNNVAYFGNVDLWIGNTGSSGSTYGKAHQLRFYQDNTGNTNYPSTTYYTAFKAPSSFSSGSIVYTLPAAAPAANGNLLLATSGASSTMSWSSGLVWDNTNSRAGINTTSPSHPLHSVNSATTDEIAAVYGVATGSTSNQAIGVWGDANNTGSANTGSIGVLATGNGNTTVGQTNVALQVNDGEFTMGRTSESPGAGSDVSAATAGTAYSAEGPSGVVELTLGGAGNLVTAAPTASAIQSVGTITINNRYCQSGSIILLSIVGMTDDGNAPDPRDAAFILNVDNTANGSFSVRVKVIPAVTNAANYSVNDKVRIGYVVVNKSR